jgi:hypothetical protein
MSRHAMIDAMPDKNKRSWPLFWLGLGAVGFLAGLGLLVFSQSPALSHLALILTVASPVIAFWRLMKPRLAPHCPRPPTAYE